ncbi:MAG: phage tail tape measure protein, partial [Planctomycetota bacterium]
VLETSARAATAGLSDTLTAVDIITTGLNAYGMEADRSGEISDQLFTAVRLGKTTFNELAGSLGQVLPFSSQLGVSFGEVSAAMATLTAAGLQTEIATTALRGALVSFIQGADKFESAGIDILKVVGERGLAGGLDALKKITGGNIEAMREFVPETRALAAVLSLAGEQADKFTAAQREMENASGATTDAFKKQSDTLEFAKKEWVASFDALSISLGEKFLPVLIKVTKAATAFLDIAFQGTSEDALENARKRISLIWQAHDQFGNEWRDFLQTLPDLEQVQSAVEMAASGLNIETAKFMLFTHQNITNPFKETAKEIVETAEGVVTKLKDVYEAYGGARQEQLDIMAVLENDARQEAIAQEDEYEQQELDRLRALTEEQQSIKQQNLDMQAYADAYYRAQDLQAQQEHEDNIRAMRAQTLNSAVALLNILAGKSKAAAIAGIAITKAMEVAKTIQTTLTAATLAYASQLIPGDPTSIARATAAAASTKAWGYANAALIAATGFAQAAGVGGGGGPSAGGAGGYGAPRPEAPKWEAPYSYERSEYGTGFKPGESQQGYQIVVHGDVYTQDSEEFARKVLGPVQEDLRDFGSDTSKLARRAVGAD